jgi:hypothetical protein
MSRGMPGAYANLSQLAETPRTEVHRFVVTVRQS